MSTCIASSRGCRVAGLNPTTNRVSSGSRKDLAASTSVFRPKRSGLGTGVPVPSNVAGSGSTLKLTGLAPALLAGIDAGQGPIRIGTTV